MDACSCTHTYARAKSVYTCAYVRVYARKRACLYMKCTYLIIIIVVNLEFIH